MPERHAISPAIALLLLLFIEACLLACTPDEQSANRPDGIREVFDLAYYAGEDMDSAKHRLNLFIPTGIEDFPLILWIHGGAWALGDRAGETELARRFAEQGIGVAAMSYRLSPGKWITEKGQDSGVHHPEHIKDVARAFYWLHTNAERYGYDRQALFVSGYSAGGQLSALLASDERYLKNVGLAMPQLKGAIPIAGAYDMEAYYRTITQAFGREKADAHVLGAFGRAPGNLREASPTRFVSTASAPMLVISETDTYDYTLIFEAVADSLGLEQVGFHHVRDKNHKELFFSMNRPDNAITALVAEFVRRMARQ